MRALVLDDRRAYYNDDFILLEAADDHIDDRHGDGWE